MPLTPWQVDGGGCELGITAGPDRTAVLMLSFDDNGNQFFEVLPGSIPFIVEAANFWHLYHVPVETTYHDFGDGHE